MTICQGGERRGDIGAFPGDTDRCSYCGKWLKVRQDGTVGPHQQAKNPDGYFPAAKEIHEATKAIRQAQAEIDDPTERDPRWIPGTPEYEERQRRLRQRQQEINRKEKIRREHPESVPGTPEYRKRQRREIREIRKTNPNYRRRYYAPGSSPQALRGNPQGNPNAPTTEDMKRERGEIE